MVHFILAKLGLSGLAVVAQQLEISEIQSRTQKWHKKEQQTKVDPAKIELQHVKVKTTDLQNQRQYEGRFNISNCFKLNLSLALACI